MDTARATAASLTASILKGGPESLVTPCARTRAHTHTHSHTTTTAAAAAAAALLLPCVCVCVCRGGLTDEPFRCAVTLRAHVSFPPNMAIHEIERPHLDEPRRLF